MNKHPSYVTIGHGLRGIYCVLMCWSWINKEQGEGFYEPWTTSDESFDSHQQATEYGRQWAQAEGLEFRP